MKMHSVCVGRVWRLHELFTKALQMLNNFTMMPLGKKQKNIRQSICGSAVSNHIVSRETEHGFLDSAPTRKWKKKTNKDDFNARERGTFHRNS